MKLQDFILQSRPPISREMHFYLAPQHNIKTPLLDLVRNAKKTIHIEIYGFALPELSAELIAAKKRGIDVKILFDSVQAGGVKERALVNDIKAAGITCAIGRSPGHQIRHSKFMIVDSVYCEVGSLNYSNSAFLQNNTVQILKDEAIAELLIRDFEENFKVLTEVTNGN